MNSTILRAGAFFLLAAAQSLGVGQSLWPSVVQQRCEHLRQRSHEGVLPAGRYSALLEPCDTNSFVDDNSWVDRIGDLALIGRWSVSRSALATLIQDPIVTEILLYSLLSRLESVRGAGAAELVATGRTDMLSQTANREVLSSAALDPTIPVAVKLSALAGTLPSAMRSRVSAALRVKLGDSREQDTLVKDFAAAADFNGKCRAARSLGIAGTDTTSRALFLELPSSLISDGPYDTVSVRACILKAIAAAHPADDWISIEVGAVLYKGEAIYGEDNAKRLLDRVQQFGLAKYGTKIEAITNKPLVYSKKLSFHAAPEKKK